jgi:hypothetical protein
MTNSEQNEAEINNMINFYGASEYLANNKLYKIYLLCPKLYSHLHANDEHTISFLNSFRTYLNEWAKRQTILFEEDQPHQHHQFSNPGASLLVLLVPPHLIICIDGNLSLQTEKIILECILGAYLNSSEPHFHKNTQFDMEKIRQWVEPDFVTGNIKDNFATNLDYA